MAERVLITGGLGYLGSIVCEHFLDAGFDVAALDNLMYRSGHQGLAHLCANPAFEFIKETVAFGTAAPLGSVTVPLMPPV